MATFCGQTVDIYEDFADGTLEAGLTEGDADGKGTITGGQFRINHSTNSWCYIELARTENTISFGWKYTTYHGFEWGGPEIFKIRDAAWAWLMQIKEYAAGAGTKYLSYDNSDSATHGVQVADDTQYWITARLVRNGNSLFRVYNLGTHAQIGNEISQATGNTAPAAILLGAEHEAVNDGIYSYIDDYIVDWTDATFPLLGWSVAGSVVPKAMHHYKMQRRVF